MRYRIGDRVRVINRCSDLYGDIGIVDVYTRGGWLVIKVVQRNRIYLDRMPVSWVRLVPKLAPKVVKSLPVVETVAPIDGDMVWDRNNEIFRFRVS